MCEEDKRKDKKEMAKNEESKNTNYLQRVKQKTSRIEKQEW